MTVGHHTRGRPPARSAGRLPRAVLAAGLLAVLLGTGACGAGDSAVDRGTAASDDKAVVSGAERDGPAAARPAAGATSEAAPDTAAAVHVIRTATLDVEVTSVPKAVAAARATAEGAGGLVSEETTERLDGTHETSHLVLRVPQERYEGVLDELAGSGKLLTRTSAAKDVTGQVVDVESRIATQRASVARVRELMDKAGRLSDVVALEGELSSRQADLESLLAQQASLKDRTSLATITLELSEPYADGADPGDEDTGFLDALGGGWDAFVTTLRWITVAIGATAPFLAAVAVLLVLGRLLRRRPPRRRTQDRPPAPGAQAPPAP
ncbi:DUF4349 domain-containing protein [Streptomyces halstedii]|uniref:DUF4349 domain-containing protein n=2 Tax=Streptomyces TaxID=1883 RepID=UPI0037FF0F61